MNKAEFMVRLQDGLAGLPEESLSEHMSFYSEMIDDRIEDGLSEEEAVAAVGPVEDIVGQVITETPLTTLVRERVRPKRRMKTWELVLLILGSPIWLSLMIAGFAIVISIYAVIGSFIVAFWAIELTFIACAIGGSFIGTINLIKAEPAIGVAQIGFGILCGGLAIAFYYVCRLATKAGVVIAKSFALTIKKLFMRKDTQDENLN